LLTITNITITDHAAEVYDLELLRHQVKADEVVELGRMVAATDRDGVTLEGFLPGYALGPKRRKDVGPGDVLAVLPNGMQFYFWPRFEWGPDERYVVDIASEAFRLFSIDLAD
jgi:hypothetical protein